jgi:hypothetical protein
MYIITGQRINYDFVGRTSPDATNQTSQKYSDPATKQIQLIADTIFAEPTQIYQIRFPNKDINVRVLNLKSVNFS